MFTFSTQLIDARTDAHVWSESYDRDLRDVLTLQRDLAQTIASQINITLTPTEEARLTGDRPVDPEAQLAYLKGRQVWRQRSEEQR